MATRFTRPVEKPKEIAFISLSAREQIERMDREIEEAEQKYFNITSLL
jgi:hypothetical protein